MTHQQNPHYEEGALLRGTASTAASLPATKTARTIAVGSPAHQTLQALIPLFQQEAAREHGRAVREGKARAKARRLAAQHDDTAALTVESRSRR